MSQNLRLPPPEADPPPHADSNIPPPRAAPRPRKPRREKRPGADGSIEFMVAPSIPDQLGEVTADWQRPVGSAARRTGGSDEDDARCRRDVQVRGRALNNRPRTSPPGSTRGNAAGTRRIYSRLVNHYGGTVPRREQPLASEDSPLLRFA